MQKEKKNEETSDDDSQMSDSDYEDYAQDSLGDNSRHNIIRRVTDLKVSGNENHFIQSSCSATLNHPASMMNNTASAVTLSKTDLKSVYGRAA